MSGAKPAGAVDAPRHLQNAADELRSAASHQELVFGRDVDYRNSPHLHHRHVYDALLAELRGLMDDAERRGLETTLLEVGAGGGAFVEPVLAAGWSVTASEMSRPALERLRKLYGGNPRLEPVFDGDGSLEILGEERFSIILYASVLHHIPDYLAALRGALVRNLAPGGSLISLQDPIWYSDLSKPVRGLSEGSYLAYRLTRGNYLRGIQARMRRLGGRYNESQPSDTVEYHVVRDGVNQSQIVDLLSPEFEEVSLHTYWSTRLQLGQWLGERLNVRNTFSVAARGHQP